jgi:hypothetical protein
VTVRTVSRFEKNQFISNDAINQLASGRSNATGTVTLSTVASATTVSAPTCGAGSGVWLFPTTANAASVVASAYVASTDVTKGQFIVHHSSSSTTNRIFFWLAMG